MQVVTTAAADQDIDEALAFYHAPSRSADEFSLDLFQAVKHLQQWPYTGHRKRDLTDRDVCFWQFSDYYAVLNVKPGLLTIIAVLHHRRDIARILSKRLKFTQP